MPIALVDCVAETLREIRERQAIYCDGCDRGFLPDEIYIDDHGTERCPYCFDAIEEDEP